MSKNVKYPHIPHVAGAERGSEISEHYRQTREEKEDQENKDIARSLLPDARKLLQAATDFDNRVAREVRKHGDEPVGYSAFSNIGNQSAGAREVLDFLNRIIER
jgi:type II secretory pathway component PulL